MQFANTVPIDRLKTSDTTLNPIWYIYYNYTYMPYSSLSHTDILYYNIIYGVPLSRLVRYVIHVWKRKILKNRHRSLYYNILYRRRAALSRT